MRGNAYVRFLSATTVQDAEGVPTTTTSVLWEGRAELMRGAEQDRITPTATASRTDAATILMPRRVAVDLQAFDGAAVQLLSTNEVARVVAVNPIARHLHLLVEGPLTPPPAP